MTETYGFAAEILRRSAAGYAGSTASLMLEKEPELAAQAGAFGLWKRHLTQRLLELAAALDAGQPALFSARVAWSRKTFAARNQDERLLHLSIAALRDVLAEGVPEKAAEPIGRFVDDALSVLQQPAPELDPSVLNPEDSSGRLALNYLQDVLDGNGAEAIARVVQAVAAGLAPTEAYIDVLLAAQKEIGRLWHANEVSVAEEHLVSMATQKAMAIIAHLSERAPSNGATVVVACATGNSHDMGARALADLYQLAGWRSIFLGADVPVADLPAMLDAFDAQVLSLSSTLSTQLGSVAEAIASIREQCNRPVKIIVGGAAFDEAPGIAEEMGADAYAADLRDALPISAGLLG